MIVRFVSWEQMIALSTSFSILSFIPDPDTFLTVIRGVHFRSGAEQLLKVVSSWLRPCQVLIQYQTTRREFWIRKAYLWFSWPNNTVPAPNFGLFYPKMPLFTWTGHFEDRKPLLFNSLPPKTQGRNTLSWPPWPWFRSYSQKTKSKVSQKKWNFGPFFKRLLLL